MKKYSHANWNQVLALPDGPDKKFQLGLIGAMAKGNLAWFVRVMIAMEEDINLAAENPSWNWQLIEPTEFTRRRRVDEAKHENPVSQD